MYKITLFFLRIPSFQISVAYLNKTMASNRYCIDLAKRGTAGCKECKKKIDKGMVRIAKILPNPFTESGGEMKQWFHVRCIFTKLSRARASTKKIDSTDDLEGWDEFPDENKDEVLQCLKEFSTGGSTPKKTPAKKGAKSSKTEESTDVQVDTIDENSEPTKDDALRQFRKICAELENHSKYTEKTALLSEFFENGSDGEGFKGNLYLWIKMLLPAIEKRIYNLKATQIVKIFSKMFDVSHKDMLNDYEKGGDVSATVQEYFENSNTFEPAKKSSLYLQDVNNCLDELCKTGVEIEQSKILCKIAKRCTSNDLKCIVRLINHDLRINAGPKPILGSINDTAYEAFQSSRNLKSIVQNVLNLKNSGSTSLTVQASVMIPVLPMLAMACKDFDTAFKRCPKGFYVELKYDGERVQVHKNGNEFSYFSRSLKPVMPHKVNHLKEFIPKAFPHGNNMILDSEILLVENDGTPLPFGTLGAHRQNEFQDASVCLFVFDCLHFNNENLMNKPFVERRKILEDNMTPLKNRVMFSELTEIKKPSQLKALMLSVRDQGLEGIVIKDKFQNYEPGKRHWLKMKKDYLKSDEGVSMADSADLVVLGGYYGTGIKGGKVSVYLMGCYDKKHKEWCTVTKVGGFKDNRLEELQDFVKEKMKPTNKSLSSVPDNININKALLPDFIIKDPEDSPVWEISGAEYSKADIHTAAGISIRFPRVSRVRDDKDWKTATSLEELQNLYEVSKDSKEVIGLKVADDPSSRQSDEESSEPSTSTHQNKKAKKEEKSSKNLPSTKSAPQVKKTKSSLEDDSAPSKRLKATLTSPNKKSSEESSSSEVLPNIFTGVKLYIPTSVDNYEDLRRYFVAYDGDLLKKFSKDATHQIITEDSEDSSTSKNVEKVTVDWLWDSIKLKKRLKTKMYKE